MRGLLSLLTLAFFVCFFRISCRCRHHLLVITINNTNGVGIIVFKKDSFFGGEPPLSEAVGYGEAYFEVPPVVTSRGDLCKKSVEEQ